MTSTKLSYMKYGEYEIRKCTVLIRMQKSRIIFWGMNILDNSSNIQKMIRWNQANHNEGIEILPQSSTYSSKYMDNTIWYVFFSKALNGIFPKSINTSSVISNKTTTSTSVNKKKHTTHETHFKRNLLWRIFILSREYLLWYTFYRVSQSYCWKKSCTSWYGKYPWFTGFCTSQVGLNSINFYHLISTKTKTTCRWWWIHTHSAIGPMYGIFNYIWLIFMVNVGKYSIHGSYK